MTFDDYIAAMNERVRQARSRKDEQAREAEAARNGALDAAADYMRDIARSIQGAEFEV